MSDSTAGKGGAGARRRALGRCLDALLPSAPGGGLRTVDVLHIEPNPNQPRQQFDPEALESLAGSLREHGLLQPLVVTESSPGRYRLIVGERRWQASKRAGLTEVPVIVREASDRETLELALIENVQRHDLNPLEEAAAYQRLMQDYGLSQQDIASRMGRSRVAITNTLRLLALPDTVRRAVIDGRVTEGHARALLGLSDATRQLAALELIERDGLSVRQTEELVRRLQEPPPEQVAVVPRHPDIAAAEDDLRRVLGTRVTLAPRKRGGRIVIEYYSDDEFEGLYRRLMGED